MAKTITKKAAKKTVKKTAPKVEAPQHPAGYDPDLPSGKQREYR
jgi:hypothetical protein